jgi:SAM-dependent methyltransferase
MEAASTVACLICGGSEFEPILDLGETPLANALVTSEEVAAGVPRYPLRVVMCSGCSHVQLGDHVDPAAMFHKYLYVSSASDTLLEHFEDLSDLLMARRGLGADDLVVDIGCNDTSLLHSFQTRGVRTLGVDPAANLAESWGQGVDRIVDFFGFATAEQILDGWGPASLVTLTNTFPHLQDLDDFVRGLKRILAPGGALVIEAHYAADMLAQTAFDTIYHEHVSYWRLGTLSRLFEGHGLEVIRAELLPLHHGQIRVTVQRSGEKEVDASVAEVHERESRAGLDRLEPYREFADRVKASHEQLHHRLEELREAGRSLAGYGAPAKATILLNYMNIGVDLIPYICDRSTLKQGLFVPGTSIPIVAPERLLDDQPDYVLLLAWNFAEEVARQQSVYRERGGRILVPLPELHEI